MDTRKISRRLLRYALATTLGVTLLGTTGAFAQQASITLTQCDGKPCYSHDNTWTIEKKVTENTVANGVGTVTWTVTATKDSSAAATYSVHGGVTIKNTGSAPATIGNIVVNLQKPNSPKKGSNASHVSIAANVADATQGDAATKAYLVASGSQENAATNAAWGTNNYTVSGAQGTFKETSCSGTLEFTDASNNTLFSLVPQPVIPVGESVTLLYHATFNTACLPAPGTALRVETLVSFGNAGARGGSGATASNVDINGDGLMNAGEDKVRTVPCRIAMAPLPAAPDETNDSVSLGDAISASGTVTVSNVQNNVPATTNVSGSWTVSADVDAGTDGGQVCNEATLDGTTESGELNVIIGYDTSDPLNPIPVYLTYECAEAAHGSALACASISAPEPEIDLTDGDFCSFSQGGLGGSGYPYNMLAANFVTLYPSGVEVGIAGAGGFSMKFTSASAVQTYLPAGGPANKLTADSSNPTSTSAGQFGGQVLALKLNVALSGAGATNSGFGDLYYCDAVSSLNGKTVKEILDAAEIALGGGALPAGYTYATLATLTANLDLSFDGKDAQFPNCGVESEWAAQHLSKTACP